MINEQQLKQQLDKLCLASGGAAAFARQHNISGQYICDCLKGRRPVGKKILAALNYKRIILYKKTQ